MYQGLSALTIGVLFTFYSVFFTGQAAAMPKQADSAQATTETGTVVETLQAPGYTYMLVADGPQQTWVAIPETAVKTGTQVRYSADMVMKNFSSKTLNKTFETIVFSSGLIEGTDKPSTGAAPEDSFAAAVKSEQKDVAGVPVLSASGGSSGAVAPLQEISVTKAEAENSYSVEELFAKAKELNGQKVVLRGKVVKFSPNIMGRNWVHIQDGSGNPLSNTHDMVVTTGESVDLGAIVMMEGVLAADKDFGAGYKYASIIEQASLIK